MPEWSEDSINSNYYDILTSVSQSRRVKGVNKDVNDDSMLFRGILTVFLNDYCTGFLPDWAGKAKIKKNCELIWSYQTENSYSASYNAKDGDRGQFHHWETVQIAASKWKLLCKMPIYSFCYFFDADLYQNWYMPCVTLLTTSNPPW